MHDYWEYSISKLKVAGSIPSRNSSVFSRSETVVYIQNNDQNLRQIIFEQQRNYAEMYAHKSVLCN